MKILVIGGGISGLASAALLAKAGYSVDLFEKNASIGGRARQFTTENGFTFDMGPSWYWMPEVFEKFYNEFGYKTSDLYELKRIDPSYRVYWKDQTLNDISTSFAELQQIFETEEKGSSVALEKFMADAEFKYNESMARFIHQPGNSIFEYANWKVLKVAFRLSLLTPFSKFVRRYFKSKKILSLLEFPILFLGAKPSQIPALYSLMNYADVKGGTWYPMGGMFEIVKAFEKIALEQGVRIHLNADVREIQIADGKVTGVLTQNENFDCDILVSGADYRFTEKLLGEHANYNESYWKSRVMAPSCLVFYVGLSTKIPGLKHHNLFFDADFDQHAHEIYDSKVWPTSPLFYVCAPSVTDPSVAPEEKENLFFLVPIANDLDDTDETKNRYFDLILERFENRVGMEIRSNIIFKRSYCISDFKTDYNAFRGNAYGLANTLKQTAFLKPKLRNRKLKNCFYTGQLTVPGPGLPPAIVSGEIVASEIIRKFPLQK